MSIDVGRVASSIYSVIIRHPVTFLGLSLVVNLPQGLAEFSSLNLKILASGFFLSIIYFVLGILLQALLIVATVRDITNQEVHISQCLREVLNRFWPLIGLTILSGLGIGLGFLLIIVPGIILMLVWIVAVPAMMTENLGVTESLSRSEKLTSGSKGIIFLLAIVYGFTFWAISELGIAVVPLGTPIAAGIAIIGDTLLSAIQAAGVAALYIELRTVKEGPLTNALADVFA